jgi:hypothetical protein
VRAVLTETVDDDWAEALRQAANHVTVSGSKPSPLFWFTTPRLFVQEVPTGEGAGSQPSRLLETAGYRIQKTLRHAGCEDTKEALADLKKYSGKKNIIERMRNEFAFHYDSLRVRTQLSSIEETDKLKIEIAETEDVFFQLSEIIVGSAMLEAVQPGDFVAAAEKFFKEIMNLNLSSQLVDFCDGCLHYMIKTYIGYQSEVTEIPDPPNWRDLRLPFFSK